MHAGCHSCKHCWQQLMHVGDSLLYVCGLAVLCVWSFSAAALLAAACTNQMMGPKK